MIVLANSLTLFSAILTYLPARSRLYAAGRFASYETSSSSGALCQKTRCCWTRTESAFLTWRRDKRVACCNGGSVDRPCRRSPSKVRYSCLVGGTISSFESRFSRAVQSTAPSKLTEVNSPYVSFTRSTHKSKVNYASSTVSSQRLCKKSAHKSSCRVLDVLETCFYILETMSGSLEVSQLSPPVVHELGRQRILDAAAGQRISWDFMRVGHERVTT